MIRLAAPQFGDDEFQAVKRVLESGMLIQGEYVRGFESAVECFLGRGSARAVSSGTAALHLALLATGIGSGDAVLVPAFTFPATANVVETVGARPVFVDVDPLTYCINGDLLRKAITNWCGPERLRAVIPVHEFGAPCPMEEIMCTAQRHSLIVIEDAACAFGTKCNNRYAGTIGDVGCFSWHPRKAITTGEGGMVISPDPLIVERVDCYRNHGIQRSSDGAMEFVAPGLNYRLTEFQAAIGIHQLMRYEAQFRLRQRMALHYMERLKRIPDIQLPADIPGHAWQTYMIVLPDRVERKQVINELRAKGIESNLGAQAIHMLTYYSRKYRYVSTDYPNAATLYTQGMALPLHAGITETDIEKVCSTLSDLIDI